MFCRGVVEEFLLVSHLASFDMAWSLASASVGGVGAPFTACAATKALGFCDGKIDSMNCSIYRHCQRATAETSDTADLSACDTDLEEIRVSRGILLMYLSRVLPEDVAD